MVLGMDSPIHSKKLGSEGWLCMNLYGREEVESVKKINLVFLNYSRELKKLSSQKTHDEPKKLPGPRQGSSQGQMTDEFTKMWLAPRHGVWKRY